MKKINSLDTIGLRCPEPIMMLRKTIRNMHKHEIIKVLADDPSTTRDIPSFCQFMDHILIESQILEIPYFYVIQKGK